MVGPPGSGKSTYCAGLEQYFRAIGRPCALINLDPANEEPRYACDVDIKDLVVLENVQEELGLGPNGGLIFSLEYLEKNLDWLEQQLREPISQGKYLIFDLPGQVELFTCHSSLLKTLEIVTNVWNIRLASVQLVDCHLCSEPSKFLSAIMVSLSTMLHLGLPHVNVLSKVDLMGQLGELEFQPQYFLNPNNLEHLAEAVNDRMHPKFAKGTRNICNLLEDYGIVNFAPLAVEDVESLAYVVRLADKANGYAYTGAEESNSELQSVINRLDADDPEDIWERIEERLREKGPPAPQIPNST